MYSEFSKRLRELLILLTLYLVPSLLTAGNTSSSVTLSAFVAIIIRNVAYALLLLYITDIAGESRLIVGHTTRFLRYGLLIGVILFTLSSVIGYVGDLFGGLVVIRPFTMDVNEYSTPTLIGLILTLISVAVTEEIFFRGYLLLRLEQLEVPSGGAIVIMAILFAAGHSYQGVEALIFSFSAAIILGILWKRRPNIVAFSLGHGIYNLVAILAAGI